MKPHSKIVAGAIILLPILSMAVLAGCGTGVGADAPICVNDRCSYHRLDEAFAAAGSSSIVTIKPGIYRQGAVVRGHSLVIQAEGAHLQGVAVEGKAALVIRGRNVLIEGLECLGISVRDRNGACIRLEGSNLTLRKVYFHDSDEGVLGGGGTVLIEDSIFERLGRAGQAHGIYINDGDALIIRRSYFLASQDEGHEVKSRAARTIIEDSVIASLDGDDSRLIDVPNGGEVIIRNSILQEGPNSVNENLVGVGLERQGGPKDHEQSSLTFEGNTVIVDRPGRVRMFHLKDVDEINISGNVFVGGHPLEREGNEWHRSRSAAGLRPYPFLPQPRGAADIVNQR